MATKKDLSKSEKELIDNLNKAVDEAESILKEVAEANGEKAQELREKAKEALRNAAGTISDTRESAVAQSKEMAKATDQYVHDNPWRTIGVAGLAGLLLGVIIGRR